MGARLVYIFRLFQVNKLGSGQGLIERPVQKPIELALKWIYGPNERKLAI